MSEEARQFSGHYTLRDGSHVAMTPEEAERLWKDSERRRAERAEKLPDERAAIDAMFEAFDRLRELGWGEAMYCPKDGSQFQVIEPGSTGIHRAYYQGDWPKGSWWIMDDGDISPSHPILFRRYPEDEAKYKARMQEMRDRYRAECELQKTEASQ